MGLFRRKDKKPAGAAPAVKLVMVPCPVCGQGVSKDSLEWHRGNHFEIVYDDRLKPGPDDEAYRIDPNAVPRRTVIYKVKADGFRGLNDKLALTAAYIARTFPRHAAIQYVPTAHYNCSYSEGNGDFVSEILIIVHF